MQAPPPHHPAGSPRPWLLALGAMALGAALFGLAWNDVLPGGWTLRGWVEPHAEREARARLEHSQERLALFAGQNGDIAAGSVVFAGSSTMERFPLEELFPGAPTLDRGIGDESCIDFLERIEASRPTEPAAAWVLYLGSLDFRRLNSAPEQVVARAARAVEAIRGERSELPLALIGILPEQGMSRSMVERLAQTNAGLAEMCTRANVTFVDTARSPITGPDGSLNSDYSADGLHLNRRGYGILAGWITEASPGLVKLLPIK